MEGSVQKRFGNKGPLFEGGHLFFRLNWTDGKFAVPFDKFPLSASLCRIFCVSLVGSDFKTFVSYKPVKTRVDSFENLSRFYVMRAYQSLQSNEGKVCTLIAPLSGLLRLKVTV